MSTCICGNPAETFGGMCGRCAALQELGLASNASLKEIEDTYLTLVKVWHPDRFPTDQKLRRSAEDKLKEINAAHDYLVSGPTWKQESTRVDPIPETSEAPPKPPATPFEPDLTDEEPDEVRRILKRQKRWAHWGTLARILFIAGTIAGVALICLTADAILSSNQSTARAWTDYKDQLSLEVRANWSRLWAGATSNKEENALPPATPSAPAAPSEPAPRHDDSPHSGKVSAPAKGAQPYITAGLTPMEVLSVLGTPTSSSGEKMMYKGSEIDFRGGQVVGWKIDPKSSSIRVKLWPNAPVVASMKTFTVGSTKSDVIALQGTPTLFSDNEFGYGGSVIFFQNDRVVSWKEDPSSMRLRVAH